MTPADRPRVLCVDDEPNVLQGLARQLRQHFHVATAASGAAGLDVLKRQGPFTVVISDMRMPGMDGAAFLKAAREAAPDTVRILLTGQADLNDTIAAVNEGNIFRFLLKPCPPDVLLKALQAAVEQHRLITSERVLLRETLHGAIKTLIEILVLANPAAFGRATRAKREVGELAARLGASETWQVEVAAMLSQVGCITLPATTVDKLCQGQALTEEEQATADRLPEIAGRLLANIPRLDPVREILTNLARRYDGSGAPANSASGEGIPWGARLLKVILDFDDLRAQGTEVHDAIAAMKGRRGWYDPAILEAYAALQASRSSAVEKLDLPLRDIEEGMIFADDVKTRNGLLLIARGHEVTTSILERIRNLSPSIGVKEPIQVIVRRKARVGEPVSQL